MLSLFRKFISNSNESSQIPFIDETFASKLEIFIFKLSTKEWLENVSGTIFIEKLEPPQTSLMIIKIESHPYNLIRKITRDFELLEKDERTWMFRVYEKTKSTDYNESSIIACRFSTKIIANKFYNFIKDLQNISRAGFENLNFRLEIIRKKHEEELLEKNYALAANFPTWDYLLNGKYYQNFYNIKNNLFQCMTEIREFDNVNKKWKELILGIVKIEIEKDNAEQSVLTVMENNHFIKLVITKDVELIALDNKTWMWRGYKKYENNVENLLIGCRFINTKIAQTFGINILKAQKNAPSRCNYRDEYMSELFKKENEIKLSNNQIALETNFPGEYEIIDNDDNFSSPTTSNINQFIVNKYTPTLSNISLSSFSISSNDENSMLNILYENRGKFSIFNLEIKQWNKCGDGTIKILRNREISNIYLSMKFNENEFICKITQDLELMEKNSKFFIWRVYNKNEMKKSIIFLMTEFENKEISEEFKNCMKNIKQHYSDELLSDEFELNIMKELFEIELNEKLLAFDMNFPSHVDIEWLNEEINKKLRVNENISEIDFTKGAIFHSKVDIYKFDKISNEWKKLTVHSGTIMIKLKQFQEFQKTIIYTIIDDFQGKIVIKCEIAGNLNLEMKDKTSFIWRGYTEMENEKMETHLIACRFINFHIAKTFRAIVADIVDKPMRCFLRDKYLSLILKNEREQIFEQNQIALNSIAEKEE
ncbi:uncharacterized protein LOC127282639 [Leptopilina boulardi]|uniref:uncharacterized protein LOC127282639 n=1 Tax=Leptopilina boulardi TaxID=63433 RepID=UPI0021F696C4|nr:uncharacterized protein LOC127282639 [Leptopilina boulardi]